MAEQQTFWEKLTSKKDKEDVKKIDDEFISMGNNESSIVDLIVKCSKEATKEPDESRFADSLDELVRKLKVIFKSEYCAIGTVDEKYVIDRACTLNLSNDIRRAPIDSKSILVCKSLGYSYKNAERKLINRYNKNDIVAAGNYEKYKVLLNKEPENSTIIIIQDDDEDPQGFLQFINSESEISKSDYEPYEADLLRLAFVVKQWYALEQERLFIKDFKFINSISENTNKVDNLLYKIMNYLSTEFNAGVISYRIPLLVGTIRQPLFFLRDCFVSNRICNHEDVKKRYFRDRMVKTKDEMGGVDKLICRNYNDPVILAEPFDSASELGISSNIDFKKDAVIIPIIHNHSEEGNCKKTIRTIKEEECQICKDRFEMFYGIFKLRILKARDDDENDSIPNEVKDRLHNLAIHISVLLNAIVDKDETDSLQTFQTGLNDSSFTDFSVIKEFDRQCAKTIKISTGAKVCAIYKFDKLSNEMVLSAPTQKTIQMYSEKSRDELYFGPDFNQTLENCKKWFPLENQAANQVFENDEPVYYVTKENMPTNSLLLVPMLKKDGTRLGMILLIGKGTKKWGLSKTYWEHDKKYIKFMVDILSRIEESDADRLVFLLRLSHELRKPITEMVYKNDLLLSTAVRNKRNISRGELLNGLRYNMNACMMFKQIIGDTETSYCVRKGSIIYQKTYVDVKECLLDVIRLFEQGGGLSEKSLMLKTQLSQMPQTMYVDKERIKQVFVNLLKNAIQYSNNYSTITISYSFNERRKWHEINFENYGIGITEEEKDVIFDLWKRGESAKKKRPNGTGMGLSIVREIMTAHKGDCYVKQLDNPTIFTVCIPKERSK